MLLPLSLGMRLGIFLGRNGFCVKLCTFLNAYVVWVAVASSPRSSEIQELDSNMQYLVYENHSKFIKASETIREVGKW